MLKTLNLLPGNPNGAFLVQRISRSSQLPALNQSVDQSAGHFQHFGSLGDGNVLALSHRSSIPHIAATDYTLYTTLDNTADTRYNVDIADTTGTGGVVEDTRLCIRCRLTRPVTDFYLLKNGKRYTYCRACAHQVSSKSYRLHHSIPIPKPVPFSKQCNTCSREVPTTGFPPHSNKCRDCTSVYLQDWRAKNREKTRAYHAKIQNEHHEKLLQAKRDYWQRRGKDVYKAYVQTHREQFREKDRRRLSQMDPIRLQRRRYQSKAARRARLAQVAYETVHRDAIYERDAGICWLCGKPVDPKRYHLDHVVPLAKGGPTTGANLRVAHPTCNVRKGTQIIAATTVAEESPDE